MSRIRSRLLSLLIALMIALTVQAGKTHGEGAPVPELDWSKEYGAWSAGEGVIPTSDGGYLAMGSLTEQEMTGDWESYSQKAYIVKVDAEGTTEWEQKLAHAGSETNAAYQAIETKDGGYLVIGSTTNTSGQPFSQLLMIRLDGSGRIVWEQSKEEDGIHSTPQAVVETDGGDFLIGGKGISNMSYSTAYILKVNGSGQELWYKKYRFGDSQYFNDLIPAVDGGYIAVGGIDSPDYEPGDQDALLMMKVNDEGEQLWMKQIGDPGTDWGAFAVTPSSDGGYMLGSQKVINQQRITVLTKTDADGQALWQKTYAAGADVEVFNQLVKTADGYALLGGNASGDYLNRKIQYDLMSVNGTGEEMQRTLFKGAQISRYGKGSAAHDGGFVFPGTVKLGEKTKLQLMKLAPVDNPAPEEEKSLSDIAFSEQAKTLKEGTSAPTVLQAKYADGSSGDLSSAATYRSDNPDVATVDATGRVTALSPGETRIQADFQNQSAALKVTVLPENSEEFEPAYGQIQFDSEEYSLAAGALIDLHLIYKENATGIETNVTDKAVFRSDHPDIAGVDAEGNLVGRRAGTTRIYAAYKGKSVSAIVQVMRASSPKPAVPEGSAAAVKGTAPDAK
ncbi:Ig-like domain-containing protein [Paenibacillus sp. SAF-054]|uniref:Ig-like domain-containing protein n=1 Tax=unclassified Paenibacillus TaxID=185978 RepID=UPI003F801122